MSCTVLKTKMKPPRGLLDDVRDAAGLRWMEARALFSTPPQQLLAKKNGLAKKRARRVSLMLPMDKQTGKKRALASMEPLDLGEPSLKKPAHLLRSVVVGLEGK